MFWSRGEFNEEDKGGDGDGDGDEERRLIVPRETCWSDGSTRIDGKWRSAGGRREEGGGRKVEDEEAIQRKGG